MKFQSKIFLLIFFVLSFYKQFDFFIFKTLFFFSIRDPVHDPIRSGPDFVDAGCNARVNGIRSVFSF